MTPCRFTAGRTAEGTVTVVVVVVVAVGRAAGVDSRVAEDRAFEATSGAVTVLGVTVTLSVTGTDTGLVWVGVVFLGVARREPSVPAAEDTEATDSASLPAGSSVTSSSAGDDGRFGVGVVSDVASVAFGETVTLPFDLARRVGSPADSGAVGADAESCCPAEAEESVLDLRVAGPVLDVVELLAAGDEFPGAAVDPESSAAATPWPVATAVSNHADTASPP
ncbi:hypothetical protein [Mycolicibacterium aurum]|uniref:hypothetical protein n=1 Tax=Mycolicibacterium aurum TaxID=1791 RepID=UPI000F843776|nr:hypothetical protein [Mycolicibacterium aurum]